MLQRWRRNKELLERTPPHTADTTRPARSGPGRRSHRRCQDAHAVSQCECGPRPARGALPRDPGVCRTLWRCLSVSRAEGGCVWHFQRTTRAQTYLTNQSVHRTVRLTPNLHDTTLDDDGARQVEIFRPKMGQICWVRFLLVSDERGETESARRWSWDGGKKKAPRDRPPRDR